MSVFGMSEEERKKISDQHKVAMKKERKVYKNLKKRKKIRNLLSFFDFLYLAISYNRYIIQKRIPQYNTVRDWPSINPLSVILGNTVQHRIQMD